MKKTQNQKNKYALNKVFAIIVCFSMLMSLFSFNISASDQTIADPELVTSTTVDGDTSGDVSSDAVSNSINPSINLSQSEYAVLTSLTASFEYGDFELNLPANVSGETYAVTLHISRYFPDGSIFWGMGDEVYYVEVANDDGSKNTALSGNYQFSYSTQNATYEPELVVTISGVPAGSKISVDNIVVAKSDTDTSTNWSDYDDTYMKMTIVDENDPVVLINTPGANPALLIANDEVVRNAYVDNDSGTSSTDRVTADDFLVTSDIESYTLMHFLNYYNVVSLDDIESTHIVGPIIAQNIARRTADEIEYSGDLTVPPSSNLAAADYSRGIFSYAGILDSYGSATTPNGSSVSNSSFTMNYAYDLLYQDINGTFVAPYFYTKEEGHSIYQIMDGNSPLDYISLDDDASFLSPNNFGAQLTYQNDDFIDFETLDTVLNDASDQILTNGNAEGSSSDVIYKFDASTLETTVYTTSTDTEVPLDEYDPGSIYGGYNDTISDLTGVGLTIGAEQSWLITNSIGLVEFNIIMPDDYNYFNNPFLFPTTINFEEEQINPTTINGSVHSQFPYTYVNGYEFETERGEDHEYSEVGTKIIWNLPNVVTTGDTNRLVTVGNGQNISGHIIAPQAEFWNYDNNGNDWEGGNINGTVIFKSMYSGRAEMHMWPYTGYSDDSVVYGVEALKKVDGDEPTDYFDFELDVVRENDESIPTGIENTSFPMTAQSKLDTDAYYGYDTSGVVKFSSLVFSAAGEYSFTISEVIPTGVSTDNLTYDQSVYRIDITVADVDDSLEITKVKRYQITNSDGVDITEELLSDVLTSSVDSDYFIFNNVTTTEDTVNVSLIKSSTSGNTLSGAKFTVTEMTSPTDDAVPSGGYKESIESVSGGKITINGLEKNKYYKLVETSAPSGYITETGYWVLYIDNNGYLTTTAYDGADEISDNTIFNVPEETPYLDITLHKANQFDTPLAGVDFLVERVIILDEFGNVEEVNNGYEETYTSDLDGNFTITDLEEDHLYRIKETSTPDGHDEFTGYWLIDVTKNDEGILVYTLTEYTKDRVQVGDAITNNTLTNTKSDYLLPLTGGNGTAMFYIVGASLILFSLTFKRVRRNVGV